MFLGLAVLFFRVYGSVFLTRHIKNAFVIMEFVERIVTFEETIVNVQRKSAL
ncbi:hypothetical protein [Bacillus cereus]|uniref:hypothetical protein n=1 Tax=Bacillus cereus TaxID=1396 RepID=UPI0015D479E3|nr:hypothetical protein [Bacillus cereus]